MRVSDPGGMDQLLHLCASEADKVESWKQRVYMVIIARVLADMSHCGVQASALSRTKNIWYDEITAAGIPVIGMKNRKFCAPGNPASSAQPLHRDRMCARDTTSIDSPERGGVADHRQAIPPRRARRGTAQGTGSLSLRRGIAS